MTKEELLQLLTSPEYKRMLKQRLDWGILAPALERELWHYAYGKPVDKKEITVTDSARMDAMTNDELSAYAAELSRKLATLEKITDAAQDSGALN